MLRGSREDIHSAILQCDLVKCGQTVASMLRGAQNATAEDIAILAKALETRPVEALQATVEWRQYVISQTQAAVTAAVVGQRIRVSQTFMSRISELRCAAEQRIAEATSTLAQLKADLDDSRGRVANYEVEIMRQCEFEYGEPEARTATDTAEAGDTSMPTTAREATTAESGMHEDLTSFAARTGLLPSNDELFQHPMAQRLVSTLMAAGWSPPQRGPHEKSGWTPPSTPPHPKRRTKRSA
eukprot:NODE_11152_length_1304_cov_5.234494.p1 GENE.NODE_11152_length_1304_cov_5.234494~~NODE_11152_length_1304_cov_5.234494.p1  ORF type:complete len:241 (-),score=42.17 NODE_11152_length_1304_cov_5.234494:35-757(-)